jgi:hypothetical protein
VTRTGTFRVFGVAAAVVTALAGLATVAGIARAETPRAPLPGRTYSWSYAADTLGSAPVGTRSTSGRWAVVEDSSGTAGSAAEGSSAARLLRQQEDDDGLASHTIQFLKPWLGDQEVKVRFRIRSGEIDPSAGVAFLLDPRGRSGYLIRVSGRTQELVAHYLLGGKRRDIKMVSIPAPKPDEWHTLSVRRVGERIEASYDGVLKMKLRDERFHEGNVGLWTEDDTVADFTGLSVRSL